MKFQVGQRVWKTKGYGFPGIIVAAFRTRIGQERYVVECTIREVDGMLHIFSPDQLEARS